MNSPIQPAFSAAERYRSYLTVDGYAQLLDAANQPAHPAVRVNLLKNPDPPQAFGRWSERYAWQSKPISFAPNAWQVSSAQTSPGQTIEHRFGYYYLQDAASILPVNLFSELPHGGLTLDMAASPGGKTTQLVDSTDDNNLVVANDSSANRLQALRVVLLTWGAANTAITNFAGEKIGVWFPETFDRVLLDAPCSMEGLRVSASHPFRPITVGERERLAARQLALLESAVSAAKIGAEVVYSTCTLAPEEDEAVLSAFLEKHPGTARVDESPQSMLNAPGLTEFEGRNFNPQTAASLRLWPHLAGTNGFFAAKLIKTAALKLPRQLPPTRPFKKTGLELLEEKVRVALLRELADLYGFDFSPEFEKRDLHLYRREQQLFLLPGQFLRHFSELPYYAFGFPFGRWSGSNFELSAEIVSRFGDRFNSNVWIIPDDLIAQWLKGAEIRGASIASCRNASIIAVRDGDGRNLGAGKNLPGRLRNLLPSRALLSP
ncbi:MAG TPA: RsmB/NOP family class I SAM-dependent RNA methyltransferase [Anaerolineaceae bacterium]|jgi:16S rRNA (cytosine1407-C5)-methyltransferase|nr:RsmB/NOP family class I SAM-dependent RNA methyltransferase [Anaerolineaceae bacterium]NMD27250.1 RsmB/NOP family class I SAM-dependent RNA methyltransferase [Chloroflexota bacterium]HOA20919.1 RsmB/NOP family class I SAM-dependent RNA methyltransferase [Anaerolineaceae bacterium]HOG76690.1 RsmB/NOP family class I SAM-dependent RNA methyltransferase [Anaerolineaceae bacterium]